MRLRLSTRLILGVVLIEVVMLSVLVWNSVRLISDSHAELLENSTQSETRIIANTIAPGLVANDIALVNDSLLLLQNHRTLIHLDVHDHTGKVVASLNTEKNAHKLENKTHLGLLENKFNTLETIRDETYEDALSDGIFDVVQKVELYGQHLGTLHAGYSIANVIALTNQTRLQNTSIASIEIFLSIIMAILLGLFLTKGLRQLEESAKIFGEGDLQHRVVVRGNDEISDVAHSFNKMAEHISDGQEKLKEKNKALSEQKELLEKKSSQIKLLLDSTEEGIYGVDIDGLCTFVNPACKRMLGYVNEEELIGKSIHEMIHHTHANGTAYPKEHCKVRIATLNDEPGHSDEDLHWRKDGSSFPVEWWSHPIKENNKTTGSVVTFIDIAERKSQDQQLRRSQKMDALGKLTGGIAHDYNNMLGVILGYAELLKDALTEQPELSEYIHEIQHAGERGTKLTKKLLTFSKHKPSNYQSVDINSVLQNARLMLEKTLTVRINLKFELAEDLWPVNIDLSDLEDAILNLCINAMHSIEDSGEIIFQTRNDVIGDLDARHLQIAAGEYVYLSITDTGSGMDSEIKDKIFDPFFSTKGELGTGLGLSQVYGLVKRSHGSITVHSEPKSGTRFSIYLPRLSNTKAHAPEMTTNEIGDFSGTGTILVVDDEKPLANLTSKILEKSGYRTFIATNGEEALTVMKNETIDLLFSDVIMPEMNGYQLADIVKEKYPEIKILLASGFSDAHYSEAHDEDLHDNLLQKPYTSKTLLEKVNGILGL